MKQLLFISLVLLSLVASAQSGEIALSTTDGSNVPLVYQQYGYLLGTRLDSLPSKYMQVTIRSNGLFVNYGQAARMHEQRVNDEEGNRLDFRTDNYGVIMNFFDYNGWEYLDHFEEQGQSVTYKHLMFRKK